MFGEFFGCFVVKCLCCFLCFVPLLVVSYFCHWQAAKTDGRAKCGGSVFGVEFLLVL